jgi:hypothetical protein
MPKVKWSCKILVRIKATDELLLNRVFNEQYEVCHGIVKPSLITDVHKSATAADKDFLEGGIGSAEVTGTLAEHVNADGAYQSDGNLQQTI